MNLLVPKVFAQETITVAQDKEYFRIDNIGMLISAAVNLLLIVAAILAFIYLVLGGIQWITSGGDKAGMEAARNKITHAIVGLIVVAAAYAIMLLVSAFLGFNIITGINVPTPF